MIIVFAHKEKNKFSGQIEWIADYGICTETDQYVTLPQVRIETLGAKYDSTIGEFIILHLNLIFNKKV